MHRSALLDQDDAVVEVLVHQTDSQGSVPIDVFALKCGISLSEIHSADGGTSLGGVTQGSFHPLVRDIDLEAFAATEAADCLDGIDLLSRTPVLDLNEGVMKGCTVLVVTQVDVHTSVDEELLCLESGISCGTRHVNGMMKQISTLVVNLVDVGSTVKKFLDGVILPSDEGILQSKETTCVHLVYISTEVKHPVGKLKVLLFIEIEEGCATLTVREINTNIQLNEPLDQVALVLVKHVDGDVAH